MAFDLAPWPTAGLEVQLCGDAHALNMGAYAARDGSLIFDLNDFDETCRGPFEWDLKRMAASLVLGGWESGHKDRACADAVSAMVHAYCDGLRQFSEMKTEELAHFQVTPRDSVRPLSSIFEQAARNSPKQLLKRVAQKDVNGYSRFRSEPPLLRALSTEEESGVLSSLVEYRSSLGPDRLQIFDAYTPYDTAFKVAGTGSIGEEDYLVMLYGNGPKDALFLQVKEADASCWTPYLRAPFQVSHEGRRVAEGQHRIQTYTDPLLGWTRIGSKDFLVRKWSDHKASVDVRMLMGSILEEYSILCGKILAKAHARTGDAAALSGYCGQEDGDQLDRAISKFALAYAHQAVADHTALVLAIAQGTVEAVSPN